MYILIPTRDSSAVSTSPKSPSTRRHQPLPEYADVLIAFLADLVLERWQNLTCQSSDAFPGGTGSADVPTADSL
jgi:hypothetical protein